MVDFPAVWNMIAPKLKGERRLPVLYIHLCLSVCLSVLCVCSSLSWNYIFCHIRPKVLAAMCHLFSLIPTLEVDEALQPLCDAALTFLWNCTSSAVRVTTDVVLNYYNFIGWFCRGNILQNTLPF